MEVDNHAQKERDPFQVILPEKACTIFAPFSLRGTACDPDERCGQDSPISSAQVANTAQNLAHHNRSRSQHNKHLHFVRRLKHVWDAHIVLA